MECLIDRKGTSGFSGWSPRCFILRDRELSQYKKGITNFQLCNDSNIKRRYNIFEIESITIDPKTPHIIRLEYHDSLNDSKPIPVLLKFNDVQQNKGVDKLQFIAWFRILCATSKITFNPKCNVRPLPTPFAFALYYTLQRLYKHSRTFTTPNIFAMKPGKDQLKKQYYRLMVNHNIAYKDLKSQKQHEGIGLLAGSLLYILRNMPTSLFCDSFSEEMTNKIMEIFETAKVKFNHSVEIDTSLLNTSKSNVWKDEDILIMEKSKESIALMKNYFLTKYSAGKKEHKRQNGFHVFDRYGFFTILFLLLNKISSGECYRRTKTSAKDLGDIFKDVLISKGYLFKCRTEKLISRSNSGKTADHEYEKRFARALKIIIYFADLIFPPLDKVKWKLTSLIVNQGQEV